MNLFYVNADRVLQLPQVRKFLYPWVLLWFVLPHCAFCNPAK